MNLLRIEIGWPQLKALQEVFETGKTRATLFTYPYLDQLRSEKRLLRYKSGNRQIIESVEGFDNFYRETFLTAYERYTSFFERTRVKADGRRPYSLYDLETLIFIENNKAILQPQLTTERFFSSQLFRGSKYLENNQSVLKAVLQILEINAFPKSDPKDQQWRLVIDCPDPRCIVLCENLANLKVPDAAIELNTELWYVGGNNTRILENLSPSHLTLPIYYLCDWDYDGLRIYSTIKKIISEKGNNLILLHPQELTPRLAVDSPYHNSDWKYHLPFSGLNEVDFNLKERESIRELIRSKQWIEEESQAFDVWLSGILK
ncbi:MAG: hypothetical protein JWM28_1294 [Chitinophagaceae bacterium]|nr:hypothetical protein [Chitinophagaceae bacterium]